MKEFVEKLIGRLEENGQKMCEAKSSVSFGKHSPANHRYYKAISVKKAKFIVNQLAEEYNNESVKGDLISRSAVIRELNGIYLDNPYDDKEDILEKAIGIVDHFPAPYQPKGE